MSIALAHIKNTNIKSLFLNKQNDQSLFPYFYLFFENLNKSVVKGRDGVGGDMRLF